MPEPDPRCILLAGSPLTHLSLFHRVGFHCGDPAAFLTLPDGTSVFIVRDIELPRARETARADRVAAPADFPPPGGLSGDRETATAQAAAQCLRQHGVTRVSVDRSLPYVYAEHLRLQSIAIDYDPDLGVLDRRSKRPDEQAALREAQRVTEQGVRLACELIAHAHPDADGVLHHDHTPLTSERVRSLVSRFFLDLGYTEPSGSILAGLPHNADCHHRGHGNLHTGSPVIVDLFPRDGDTGYHGDCTRTVVHGTPDPEFAAMHEAVVAANQAGMHACRAGVTGEQVHEAAASVLRDAGYHVPDAAPLELPEHPTMPHGTGHGIGLEVHEPILLAPGVDTTLQPGETLTIEPALYSTRLGGVRIENMIVATDTGHENFNTLPTGLTWA